jgi:SAM-dependent methyltransferase
MSNSATNVSTPDDGKALSNLWANIGKQNMHNALYDGHLGYMTEVQDVQDATLRDLVASETKLHGTGNVRVVDVGCSTGIDMKRAFKGRTVADLGLHSIQGIDIAADMIEQAAADPELKQIGASFVCGDATQLLTELKCQPDSPPTIVTNLGNTLGIVIGSVREAIIDNMCQLVGEKGTLLLTVWNAEPYVGWEQGFRFALDTFYQDVKDLIGGTVTEENWDPTKSEIRLSNGFAKKDVS